MEEIKEVVKEYVIEEYLEDDEEELKQNLILFSEEHSYLNPHLVQGLHYNCHIQGVNQ